MTIVGRTHHMLVSAWGKRWREVQLVLFTAYIDDSGSDPKQEVANATALIIPARQIVAMQKEWDRLRDKEGFTAFHMSEFSARNPKSEFRDWGTAKGARVFRRVRQIAMKYGVRVISFTVYKKDYNEVIPADFRKHSGMFHYTWAIRNVLSHILGWRNAAQRTEPLEYIFDWMGDKKKKNKRRREIEDLMDRAQEDADAEGRPNEFANWSFRHREDIPGLQCVDVLAWAIYQRGLLAFKGTPMPPDAITAWGDFSKHWGGRWGYDVAVKRENLKKWVNAEIADGRSAKKFEAWAAKKAQ